MRSAQESTVNMLGDFQERKRLLLDGIAKLKNLSQEMKNSSAVGSLSEAERKLSEGRFHLAVLGLFKRGKSTLINALLSTPLLPSGILPLTSVITKIRYGDLIQATVFFKNGTAKVVDIGELAEYITEKGNPSNCKNVSEVEITSPSHYLRDGVILIDTPGVGSTYLSNGSVTYNFMSKIDAAIFVLAVDPPISQGELEFLKDIKEHVRKVLFVQNKIDYVEEDQWQEAVGFSGSVLQEVLDTNVTVYPISAKLALEARIEGNDQKLTLSKILGFEAELRGFLTEGKGQIIIDSVANNALKVASDLAMSIELERKALQTPLQELETKMVWLKGEIENVTRKMNEIEYLIDGTVKEIMDRFDSELDTFKKSVAPALIQKVNEFFEQEGSKLGSREQAQKLEQLIRQSITEIYTPFIAEQDTKITKAFAEMVGRFENDADKLIDDVKREISKILDLQIHSHASGSSLISEDLFYFHTGPMFGSDAMLSDLQFLLPQPLFRKAIRKKATESILVELDKNGGRIRYDFLYRLSESARRLKSDIRNRMLTTLEAINNAISSSYQIRNQARENLQSDLEHLSKSESQLLEIRQALMNLEFHSTIAEER